MHTPSLPGGARVQGQGRGATAVAGLAGAASGGETAGRLGWRAVHASSCAAGWVGWHLRLFVGCHPVHSWHLLAPPPVMARPNAKAVAMPQLRAGRSCQTKNSEWAQGGSLCSKTQREALLPPLLPPPQARTRIPLLTIPPQPAHLGRIVRLSRMTTFRSAPGRVSERGWLGRV